MSALWLEIRKLVAMVLLDWAMAWHADEVLEMTDKCRELQGRPR